MYPQTLYPKTREVLEKIKGLPILENFYLAGGTALSLQLGHRKSVDLDFFTPNFPKRDILISSLKQFEPTIAQEAEGTLDLLISNVKVSFLQYKYPLLEENEVFESVKMACVLDIACMKLSAVSSRGSKKDFYDLYFILKNMALSDLFEAFEKKFEGVKYQKVHMLKSLVFFEDADKDPTPDLIAEVSWEDIKSTLEKEVKNLGASASVMDFLFGNK